MSSHTYSQSISKILLTVYYLHEHKSRHKSTCIIYTYKMKTCLHYITFYTTFVSSCLCNVHKILEHSTTEQHIFD